MPENEKPPAMPVDIYFHSKFEYKVLGKSMKKHSKEKRMKKREKGLDRGERSWYSKGAVGEKEKEAEEKKEKKTVDKD